MGKPDAPAPPDPKETSAAQTGTNIGTAIANNSMGMVNQVTPNGSLNYSQSGTYTYTDPYTGKTYDIPTYTATTTLTPQQQAILDQNNQTQLNLAQTGNQQSAFLQDYLGSPWNPDTSEIENWIYDLGSQRLDPRFAQQEDALRTQLANQGVLPGSEAWNREMATLSQAENDAYTQLMLQGRGQAFSEMQAIRNQPINEISALMSGSQVSMPGVQMYQPQGAATTDVAGLINQNYAQQQANYQAQMAQSNSLLGGLFGLGASAITGGLFG